MSILQTSRRTLPIFVCLQTLLNSFAIAQVASEIDRAIRIETPVVQFEGRIQAAFQAGGQIKSILIHEGMQVKKGQILSVLDTDDVDARLAVANERANANEPIVAAKRNLAIRSQNLRSAQRANGRLANTIPQSELRRRELEFQDANAALALREYEQRLAKLELAVLEVEHARATIVAPFDGFVSRQLVTEGATVQASEPVLELIQTTNLRVEGYVSKTDARKLTVGDQVVVELEGKQYEATLVFIDIAAQQVRQNVRVWARMPRTSEFMEGDQVRATVRMNHGR